MDRRQFALWTVLIGLLVGFIGNVFFYKKLIGLSFPLFVLVMIVAAWLLSGLKGLPLRPRNLWPLIPMLFFAVMVAVRADSSIVTLDVLAVLALGGLTLHYLTLDQNLDEDPLPEAVRGATLAGLATIAWPSYELSSVRQWLREERPRSNPARGDRVRAVGRGLLLAMPVLLVFGLLLGSADAVFADYIGQVFAGIQIPDLGNLMGQAIVTLGLGWAACGALAYGFDHRLKEELGPIEEEATSVDASEAENAGSESASAPPAPRVQSAKPLELGIIESSIVLGSVDLLFGAFVLVQFAYFFGGRANITVERLTYAEYARRGFFELVAVSVLTLGLVLILDRITVRGDRQREMIFRALAVIVVALTVVMLVSAWQRMMLYEEAYGFTGLRVYTHVFMIWLGALFGMFLLSLFRMRKNIFSLGVLIVLIGYLATLNLMNVELYIAERNIARYHDGRELDTYYLSNLSADATPAMVSLYEDTAIGTDAHHDAGRWLFLQLLELDQWRDGAGATVFSANVSREYAWTLLDPMREELSAYRRRDDP